MINSRSSLGAVTAISTKVKDLHLMTLHLSHLSDLMNKLQSQNLKLSFISTIIDDFFRVHNARLLVMAISFIRNRRKS